MGKADGMLRSGSPLACAASNLRVSTAGVKPAIGRRKGRPLVAHASGRREAWLKRGLMPAARFCRMFQPASRAQLCARRYSPNPGVKARCLCGTGCCGLRYQFLVLGHAPLESISLHQFADIVQERLARR